MSDPISLPSQSEISGFFAVARAIIARNRELILQRQQSGFSIAIKSDLSEVTEVDHAVEEAVRNELAQHFPDHGIIGEEFAPTNLTADFQWYIDPIDGTQNFARQIPTFGSILALHYKGRPIVGCVDHPMLGQSYSAAYGEGAWCNGRKLSLADLGPGASLEYELVTLSSPAQFVRTNEMHRVERFLKNHTNVRIYGDCFSQTCAISGKTGAAVHFNVKAWDVAAARILVEEAGGKCLTRVVEESERGGPYWRMVLGKPRVVDYLSKWFLEEI